MRPATLAASVAPVLAGTAIAVHDGGARPWAGLAALVVAIAIQIGVNFVERLLGLRPRRRHAAAGSAHCEPHRPASSRPSSVKWAAIAAFAVAGAVGVWR